MPTYNVNPPPRPGSYTDTYGGVPGAIDLPDPFADLERLYPNLSQTNAQASRNILAGLRGELSPETLAGLQDDAARYGITSGMPGSDLSFRRGVTRTAGAREALQNNALQNFLNTQTTMSRTQAVSPELQSQIADRNSVYAAAPVPQTAARNLQALFGGGAPGGGSVTYSGGPGGMRPTGTNPPGPNDFWSGPTRGTGWDAPAYNGAYISPLPSGFSPGPQGKDLWSVPDYNPVGPNPTGEINYNGDWRYGVEAGPADVYGPSNQYDPTLDYSGYEGPINYGEY